MQDTTTVDTNVSRHLGALLADRPKSIAPPPSAFDAAILHFLGLDHVGHLGGSSRLADPQMRAGVEEVLTLGFCHLASQRSDGPEAARDGPRC